MMKEIQWETCEPARSPFAIVAKRLNGEEDIEELPEYQVFLGDFAGSKSSHIRKAVSEVVNKVVSFLPDNRSPTSNKLLFYWDPVYSTMTVVVTDDHLVGDSRNVVKCVFSGLDSFTNKVSEVNGKMWEIWTWFYSRKIRSWVKKELVRPEIRNELKTFNVLPVFTTDQNRRDCEILIPVHEIRNTKSKEADKTQ